MNIETFLKIASDIPGRTVPQLTAQRLSISEAALRAWPDRELPSPVLDQLNRDLADLREGVPTAYVFGEVPFLEWDFKIDRRALIPRPETEALCDQVRKRLEGRAPQHILDLCCGSGVMGLSMGLAFPQSQVHLTDISKDALALAAENRDLHGLGERVTLGQGDLWEAVNETAVYDLLVCNPPYVAEEDEVQEEVLSYEPHEALYSGDRGMAHVKRILERLPQFLTPRGLAVFELGHDHQKGLSDWLESFCGLDGFFWEKDPFGVPRFLIYDGFERG